MGKCIALQIFRKMCLRSAESDFYLALPERSLFAILGFYLLYLALLAKALLAILELYCLLYCLLYC